MSWHPLETFESIRYNGGSAVVDQSTRYPKFEGLNPATAGAEKEEKGI